MNLELDSIGELVGVGPAWDHEIMSGFEGCCIAIRVVEMASQAEKQRNG